MTAFYFIPLFAGLSVALTVIAADLLSPDEKASATAAKKASQNTANTARTPKI